MDEKELLSKISLLKSIKPSEGWVIFVKQRIVGGVGQARLRPDRKSWTSAWQVGQALVFYLRKPAFAMSCFALLLSVGLIFQIERQSLSAHKLSALQNDQKLLTVKFAQVSREFARLVEKEPKKALQVSRNIVQLQKEKSQLEKTLGATFGEKESNDIENATKILLTNEFLDLDSRTLTESQLVLLNEAKNAFMKQDYQTALEKVWILSN